MKKLLVMSALLALAAVAMLAGPATAGSITPVGSLLFEDTYNYGATWVEDLNYGINSPSRVSGPLAGQVAYDTVNMVGVRDIDGPNLKMDISRGGNPGATARVGLTKDFNNDLALGGFTVIANLNPRGGWAGLDVGNAGSGASSIGDLLGAWDGVPGYYANVFDGSLTSAYAGLAASTFASNGTAGWYSNFVAGGYGDNYVEVALVCTDTDNNPFNGSGTITIQEYVNGDLICTASGPDFAHNYLSFQASTNNYVSIKDLRVYGNAAAVPEPGTLALLAGAAGFAFVWFRRRR